MADEANAPGQWVILRVANREYALPVAQVIEILRMVAVTPLPESPPWIAGILNLRGKGVPVMDLRHRLGLPVLPADVNAHIVVLEVRGQLLGLIADEVIEILLLSRDALQPVDRLPGATQLFSALAHAGQRLILVFDLDRLQASATGGAALGAVHDSG
jgi:purine-binding chemotaxis protein CheW